MRWGIIFFITRRLIPTLDNTGICIYGTLGERAMPVDSKNWVVVRITLGLSFKRVESNSLYNDNA